MLSTVYAKPPSQNDSSSDSVVSVQPLPTSLQLSLIGWLLACLGNTLFSDSLQDSSVASSVVHPVPHV
uniref:Uncharacterized protein n=1 Tax=Anguilla anguilla TaxID=7936 RepID=A0A0E9WKM7_ANGAN